jgi:hypothetical protein
MRKHVLIVLAIMLALSIEAQNNSLRSEVGFIASDFNHSGLIYKVGTESALWRFAIVDISGSKSDLKDNPDNTLTNYTGKGKNFSVEGRFGREYHHSLFKRIELVYGADLSFLYMDANSETTQITYSDYGYNSYTSKSSYKRYFPGINLVAGLNYKFDGPITLGIEWLPYVKYTVGYNYGLSDELLATTTGFSYGILDIPLEFSLTIHL